MRLWVKGEAMNVSIVTYELWWVVRLKPHQTHPVGNFVIYSLALRFTLPWLAFEIPIYDLPFI